MSDTASQRFAILLGGELRPTDRVRDLIRDRRIIAADGGIAHARALDCEPELWVGDFDSATTYDQNRYADTSKHTFEAAKAETDGALTIAEARARGATDLLLIGAFGGRLDHTFAVMTQAVAARAEGLRVMLTDGMQFGVPLSPEPETIGMDAGTTFSVLAFSALRGLTLENARWPLDKVTMPFGDTLTISNEAAGPVTASLDEGHALLIWGIEDETPSA